MGLDMYLEKRTYIKNWAHMAPEELHEVIINKGGKLRKDIKPNNISAIIEEIAYWRKANAIHLWFVKNVQKGEDDCGTYYVSTENLNALLGVVSKVLECSQLVKGQIQNGKRLNEKGEWEPIMQDGANIANPSVAKELLPTGEGFFFGNTDYDENYIEDLKYTKEVIESALNDGEGEGSFYYHSSW